ncbi:hypothetical protein L596_023894 [Steinernema carpocapsae]|uniref:Uncharacterized protein n=1 Tax=Steinernema carpocapsae TaxID=34508 RepID=A0A4U5MF33_STECR|nr:hypothetical protein L596_023894 [Steinernema carpocapsae]
MFRRLGGSSSLWKSKNPHSLEYLKYLHGVMVKNEKVSEGNRNLLVEALRAIAEILIWGDQNDSTVFDFFLERQMLSHFLAIMKQTSGSTVCVQLLQTLNILFENIRHETSLYFLLSNNHVNSIITYSFDFANEEIMAYYISFLKTLSFKLNTYTIHFFYNETSQEFPLYTEAIKFFNHSESMVRIAVRTTSLNIYRVVDDSMRKFIVSKSGRYFHEIVDLVADQAIEMDIFARSAENEASNRDRLNDMIAEHLDNMHYLNDILMIEFTDLNVLLTNSVYDRLVSPLYLASLAQLRETSSTILLSRVSSLFALSQFLLIIHNQHLIETVLTALFFGDQSDVRKLWTRTEKGPQLNTRSSDKAPPTSRLFFNCHMEALKGEPDDHSVFFSLLLIYAICNNKGVLSEVLEAAQIPCEDKSSKCDEDLLHHLTAIVENCSNPETTIRAVTLELDSLVLRRVILTSDDDDSLHKMIEAKVVKSRDEFIAQLRGSVHQNELFLEMFEDEYYQFEKETLRMSLISSDPALLLRPTNTPLSGIPFAKRLPCGNEERTRKTIQFYFHLRKFLHDLRGETEEQLPLKSSAEALVELNDCINLSNSDLLSCTIVMEKSDKLQRFLVTDQLQLILVEPDSKRMGWGVVRFVGLLQDTQLTGDPGDSRALHIVVQDVKSRSRKDMAPLLRAKFVFDDHIRCMAAKQRLSRGRKNARQFKLNLICDLLGMPKRAPLTSTSTGCLSQRSSSVSNPFRVARGCAPGSVRMMTPNYHPPAPSTPPTTSDPPNRSSSSSSGMSGIIPDDPNPRPSSQTSGGLMFDAPNVQHI